MKNILLFVLLTLGQALPAQVISPAGLPHITAGLSEQANAVLRIAENYPRQFGKQSQAIDRSADLRLDSIRTFGAYEQADSILASRSDFTYPTAYTTVKTSVFWDVSGLEHKNRVTTTTDADGRLLTTFSELFHPVDKQWIPSALLEQFPRGNSQSQIDSMLVKEWDYTTDDWRLVLAVHYHFDSAGVLTEVVHNNFHSTGVEVFKDLYEYNAAGDNTVITFVLVTDDGQLSLLSRVIRKFENHLMTEETLSLQNQFSVLVPERKSIITYTWFGKPLKRTEFKWLIPVWIKMQQSEFEYDTAERQIWETTQITSNGSNYQYKLFTAYQTEDLPSKTEFFQWDGNSAFLLVERDYYHYSEPVSGVDTPPVEHGTLVVSPNPSASFVTVPLEHTDALQVFDNLGNQLMQLNNIPYNAAVDLSSLPAGSYVLRAVSGNKSYTGRVVKI